MRSILGCLAIMLSSGCAAIVSGSSQTISVDTTPSGGRCEFYREGHVIGVVDPTPGVISIKKTKHDIEVQCVKSGTGTGRFHADSGIDQAVWGNILLGGLIGWGFDSALGADNQYPNFINVRLVSESMVNVPSSSGAILAPGGAQRLEQLKQWRDQGILTEKEYQQKRSEALRSL